MGKKILYIINTTAMGGGNISFINMIKGIHKYGFDIYIAHPDSSIDGRFYSQTKNIVQEFLYVPLSNQFMDNRKTLSQMAKNLVKRVLFVNEIRLCIECKKLAAIVERIKPDIISTNVGVIHGGYKISKQYDIPHVWHIREYQTKDFNWHIVPSRKKFISMLKDSYVVTITNDILQYFDLDGYKNAMCIYNGCFSEEEISYDKNKEKYFLCSSRISEEKNIDEVIDAFAIFHKKYDGYKLKIAGFGDAGYIDQLKQKIIENKIEDDVEFLGFVSDVRPLMDKATALIVASRFEGFGRMTAEAAFRGCIVIGRNTGGTREVLSKTGGFLYDGNYQKLCLEMEKCSMLGQQEYKNIVEQAQYIARRAFSIEANTEQMYRLYDNLLNKEL